MSSEILLSSSIIKAPKRKFKTPLIFPSKLNLNQRKVEQKENELLNDVHSFSVSSSLSTKGSECSDNILSLNEDSFEIPCKGILIIDALKEIVDMYMKN